MCLQWLFSQDHLFGVESLSVNHQRVLIRSGREILVINVHRSETSLQVREFLHHYTTEIRNNQFGRFS